MPYQKAKPNLYEERILAFGLSDLLEISVDFRGLGRSNGGNQ